MIPTPRTDAFRLQRLSHTGTPTDDYMSDVELDFARSLERENAAMRKMLARAAIPLVIPPDRGKCFRIPGHCFEGPDITPEQFVAAALEDELKRMEEEA